MKPFRFEIAFLTTFDIEKNIDGNYIPSRWESPQEGKEPRRTFANARLLGFSEVVAAGLAPHAALIGGDELRYRHEEEVVSEPIEIRHMLINNFGLNPKTISAYRSTSNTQGNVGIMKALMREKRLNPSHCVAITSHYHVPRLFFSLNKTGKADFKRGEENLLSEITAIPAEAVYLLAATDDRERAGRREVLLRELGGSRLAEQVVWECNGIADMLLERYRPHANFVPR